jgi:hypothetical protein
MNKSRTPAERIFDDYAVSKEEMPTHQSCFEKLEGLVAAASAETPFYFDDDVFTTVSPGLLRLAESHPSVDWSELADFSVDCWNVVVPEMGDGLEIKDQSTDDFMITAICAGVWDAAISRCARVLGIDEQAFLSAVADASDNRPVLSIDPAMTMAEVRLFIKEEFEKAREKFLAQVASRETKS